MPPGDGRSVLISTRIAKDPSETRHSTLMIVAGEEIVSRFRGRIRSSGRVGGERDARS